MNPEVKSCAECDRLTKSIDSPDHLESELAQSCYVIHLAKDHRLSSLEVLQKTGVWVEL
jgi:hypothetical protein